MYPRWVLNGPIRGLTGVSKYREKFAGDQKYGGSAYNYKPQQFGLPYVLSLQIKLSHLYALLKEPTQQFFLGGRDERISATCGAHPAHGVAQ